MEKLSKKEYECLKKLKIVVEVCGDYYLYRSRFNHLYESYLKLLDKETKYKTHIRERISKFFE